MNTPIVSRAILALALSSLTLPGLMAAADAAPGSIKQTAAPAAPLTETGVVARVGDLDVNLEEIKGALANLDVRELAAVSRDPALLNQVVRSLLVQRLLYREAVAQKWDQNAEAKAQLERLRQSAVTESYLQSVSQPPAGWPGEAEVQAAYEANKAALVIPRQHRLAQIYIALPKEADQAATEKAQARLDAVKKKLEDKQADFAAIAKVESDEKTSAANGGEIGWLTEAQIQPDIREAAVKLAAGQLSGPVRRDDGWHIIKCLEVKESFTPTLAQVKPQLVQQLRAEKAQANSQAYLARLLQENPVAINELALSQALGKKEGK
jgi:parvulin-like peptidyl-prolyl isomerase